MLSLGKPNKWDMYYLARIDKEGLSVSRPCHGSGPIVLVLFQLDLVTLISLSVGVVQWMSNYDNFGLNCAESLLLLSSWNYKEPTEELLKVYKKYYCRHLTNTIKKER